MDDRCKNVPIVPCCNDMADILMLNDIRESVLYDPESTIESGHRFMLWWKDCDCTPLKFCPSCGKPIQELKRELGLICVACNKPIMDGEHFVRLSMGQAMHMDCVSQRPVRDEE